MFIKNRDTETFGRWSDSRNVDRVFVVGLTGFGALFAVWLIVSAL